MSAMEGVGWMGVLAYGEAELGRPHIPAASVRAAAGHLHPPLKKVRPVELRFGLGL